MGVKSYPSGVFAALITVLCGDVADRNKLRYFPLSRRIVAVLPVLAVLPAGFFASAGPAGRHRALRLVTGPQEKRSKPAMPLLIP
jgi:hypothetical protein